MKIKIFATFFLQFIYISILDAQVTQDWVTRYNSSGNKQDVVSSMVIDDSGNVYVTGYTYTDSYSGDEDFLTIKYNSSGIQQWVQTYNSSLDSTDEASAIAVDNVGNVYVTGSSIGNEWGDLDWVTIKYNSAGIEQWLHRYAPLGSGEPTSIAADKSGFVYVSGGTDNTENGWLQFTTIKYDAAGVPMWITSEPFIGWKVAAMKVDISGNVYVTGPGWLGSLCGDDYNYVTIKYNPSGVKQWESFYNGLTDCSDDESKSIALDGLGNVYVTGSSEGSKYGDNDFLTVKYDSYGNQVWTARYDGPDSLSDDAYSIAVDSSENVFVTGRSNAIATGYDYATIKYNSSGVQKWVQRYDGPSNNDDIPHDLVLDALGNVYVTGQSQQWLNDYVTIKYNFSGVQQWLQRYNGPSSGEDIAVSVKVSSSGNVFVSGTSFGSGTGMDYATIKYSQSPTAVNQSTSNLPAEYLLAQNYPNPFNPVTTIKYSIAKEGNVKLTVYNVIGSKIATIVNEYKPAGNYSIQFNGSNLASGIYLYRLESGNYSTAKKFILMK